MDTVDTLGQIILCHRRGCRVYHRVFSRILASTHWMPVATLLPVVTIRNVCKDLENELMVAVGWLVGRDS